MPSRRKVVLIGLDSVSLEMLETFVRRGAMPAVARLMERGCTAEARSFFPVDTGTNWPVIVTGAPPSVTGCNMRLHLPGTPLDRMISGFPSHLCLAEQLWGAAGRAGLRSVMFDYPQSYPVNAPNVVHIGEDGRPDNSLRALQEVRAYVTELPPTSDPGWQKAHMLQVTSKPAVGWKGIPDGTALEVELPIVPGHQSMFRSIRPLYALLRPEGASLHPDRDASKVLAELNVGERSGWIFHTFATDRGEVKAAFRAKLLRLSSDGKDLHLYLSQIYPTEGFTEPPELGRELVEACGPLITQPSRQQVVMEGASDVVTYLEEQEYYSAWFARALEYVLGRYEWNLCILKWHTADWTNHLCAFMLDPLHPLYDPARAREGWALWDKVMGWGDAIVAKALEIASEEAIVAVVSDHGATTELPGRQRPDLNRLFEERGWLVRRPDGGIDWPKTKTYAGGHHYVWLNLKGRDPEGCVEPGEEFERLREEIIQFLLDQRDPHTGRHLFNLVCRKEDAEMLGVGGDRVGDIFLWQEDPPVREPAESPDVDLGTWDWPRANSGTHRPDAFFVVAGPGLKRGYRRERPVPLSAVVPTLCRASGLPLPSQAEGPVVWDFLK